MMRFLAPAMLIAAATAALPAAPAVAQARGTRTVDCEITVGGATRYRGICEYRPLGDGSFQLSGPDYFAYLNMIGPGVAEASWNANPETTHASTRIGRLVRHGACWEGRGARLCARDLTPGEARTVAAMPRGVTLYPEGAPGACLTTDGPLAPGRTISLRTCHAMTGRIFTVARDGTIGIDRHPELCLGAGGGARAPLMIAACTPAMPRWRIAPGEARPIRSSDGACLAIPQFAVPTARFPFAVVAGRCEAAGAVKFLVEQE